jgi:hypothetical protein
MSQLRFLADEDLRGTIVRAIRRLEPSIRITTVNEEGISGAKDPQVLDYCWQNRWLLLSHDVNTMKTLAEERVAQGRGLHGLFLIPQDRPIRAVAESVALLWSASEFEEWSDQVIYLPL